MTRPSNRDIAKILADLADLAELAPDREEEYRARALRAGSREIEQLAEPAVDLLEARLLAGLPGIGDGIARRVAEIAQTGRLAELDDARRRLAGLLQVARVDGIGPTTARALRDRVNVQSLDELEAAASAGRLKGVPGLASRKMGELLAAIDRARANRKKTRADLARKELGPFLDAVRAVPGVVYAEECGSLARRRDAVGDADIMAATTDIPAVAEAFTGHHHAEVVLARGARSSVVTYSGLQCDVFCVGVEKIGLARHHWIGGKEHLIALRLYAAKHFGLKMNEEGIWNVATGARLPGGERPEEEGMPYAVCGLPYIPVEMREGRGELERARAGTMPRLITAAELRGDVHVHSGEGPDGGASLEEIAAAARARGLGYVAVTDHSPARGGLSPERLAEQGKRLRALNEKLGGAPRLLHGVEVDILPDGTLDLPARALAGCDWVLAAAHGRLDLDRAAQTRRLVSAIESGLVDAIAHPSGRRPGVRDPIDVDMEEVIAAAARTDVALELNAHPERHDLGDVHCMIARERRAWIVMGTDAHGAAAVGDFSSGIDVARRAWLEAEHVLNTRPVEDFIDLVRARRREAGL